MEFAAAVSENYRYFRSCRSHDRAAVVYIAAEPILPPVSHVMEVLPLKWSIASQSPTQLSTLVEEQRDRGTPQLVDYWFKLHRRGVPLRHPKIIAAAVDLRVEQQ